MTENEKLHIASDEIETDIRRMTIRDLPEVLRIEAGSFEFPWLEKDFVRAKRCGELKVSKYDKKVVGYMAYGLYGARIHVHSFVVAPDYRRCRVGSQMVKELVGKLSAQRRTRITLEVRETNLPAQLFFRENGFRAVDVLRDHYEERDSRGGFHEDAYLMEYRLKDNRDFLTHRFSGFYDRA